MFADEAVELAQEIVQMIEEDITEEQYAAGDEFFDSVMEKAKDIGQSIQERKRASPNQVRALENMKKGVQKWIDKQ